MNYRAAALAGALLLGVPVVPALAHSGHDRRPGATKFDLEVKISRPQQPAYAPHTVADRFGNLYVTARKGLPASADDRAQTHVRTGSWRWTSADGGASWQNLPAGPAEADGKVPGAAGDVAVDDAGHAYAVDAYDATSVLLRYTATGLGHVALDGTTPAAGTAGREVAPLLAAHGDGVVFLLGAGAPAAANSLAVYASYDGGRSFGVTGVALPGARDCRLAADHRAHSKDVYATCLDGAGHVFAYASHDDARTFARTLLATYDTAAPFADVPPVAVTPDGTVYALRAVTRDPGFGGSGGTTLFLDRSADRGRTWTHRRASDDVLVATRLSLAAAPDGRLGAAMYTAAGLTGSPWFVGAGIFSPAGKLLVVSFADHTPVTQRSVGRPPDGEPDVTFLPGSRLGVTWTVVTQTSPADGSALLQDAWFVRSQAPDARGAGPDLTRTPAYAIPPCTVAGQVSRVADWQAIRRPEFRPRTGGAAADLTAYAVDPYDPRVVYVTNGTSVVRSDDGGCRWREVWSLEASPSQAMPVSAGTARVTALAVPEDRREHRVVYVVLAERQGDAPVRAHVVRSATGEPDTFLLADSGLPPAGAPGLFRVSGANPDFLYLTAGNQLYGSEDAGATWSSRTPVTEVATAVAPTVLALDPKGPNNLYAVWSGTLHHSRDGGRTWTAPVPSAGVQSAAGAITAVDVFHGDGGPPEPTAWSAPAGSRPATVLRSSDDGVTWARTPGTGLEGSVESAVHGSGRDVLVVSTLPVNDGNAEVYALDRTTRTYADVSPVATTAPFRVSADRRGHPTFYGMGPGALYRYAGSAIEPPSAGDVVDDSVFADIDPPPAPPVVTPDGANVTLLVGDTTTLPFTVDVAPRRPRIDVMVVSDTSESMTPHLPALRRDLVAALTRLAARGVDLRVGVAQDKTDAAPPVFRRERDVGPLDAGFTAALGRLDPRNGSGLETQLIGLDQLVTGAGLDACSGATLAGRRSCLSPPIGSLCEVQPESAGCAVRPGQQASFRDGTLRVVVDATDTTFRNPEGTPRGPDGNIDVAGVAASYRAAGILHVGLAVDPEGVPDLALMSALTGAVAPAGGLDCDGDGRRDVRPGAPAVCDDAAHLDGVLLPLLHAHAPLTHVHVEQPEDAVASPALVRVSPEEFEDVDRTVAQHLLARVTVTCDGLAPGHYDVPLHAEVHDETETEFGVGVDCVLPPVDVRPPPRLGVPPLLVPPVPLPAVPVPPAQPLPNVNVNAQTQVQAQAQAGAATQERDQVEVALAEIDPTPRPDEVTAAITMLAGSLGLSAAAAYGLKRRTRTAPATARR